MKVKKRFTIWRRTDIAAGKGYIMWQCLRPVSLMSALVIYLLVVVISDCGFASLTSLITGICCAAAALIVCRFARIQSYCCSRCFILSGGRLYIYAYNKLSPSGRLVDSERFSLRYMSRAIDTGRNIDTLTESHLIEHLLEGNEDFGSFATPVARVFSVTGRSRIHRVVCSADTEGKIRFSFVILRCWGDNDGLIKAIKNLNGGNQSE